MLLSDASGGYTLDGYGGLHPFGAAPAPINAAYFGWDIARDVVLLPGSTTKSASGYVLDGWGGLHPFGAAPAPTGVAYWPNFDIAKRVKLLPDGSARNTHSDLDRDSRPNLDLSKPGMAAGCAICELPVRLLLAVLCAALSIRSV